MSAARRDRWRAVVAPVCWQPAAWPRAPSRPGPTRWWVINDFHSDIDIATGASMVLTETIAVDFGQLEKHGIFRTLQVLYDHDSAHYRKLDVSVRSVVDAKATSVPYTTSMDGNTLQISVGDPDKTFSGRQSYVIKYAR